MGHTRGMENLLGGPPPTLLPDEHDAAARAGLAAGTSAPEVAQAHPAACLPWAVLAEDALEAADPAAPSDGVLAYALARTGYHRGLDALRRAGWRGTGPVPVAHEPNRGFLRALLALAEAADRIRETDEAERCRRFLADCGTSAEEVAALRAGAR